MKNKIRDTFGQIHATEQMKTHTYSYLLQQMEQNKTHKTPVRSLAVAFVLLFICIGSGFYLWETPVSYVSMDVNPSIELTLNRFNYVTRVESKNRDGAILLSHIHLTGKSYLKAVELLMESELMQSYLDRDAALTFTVASPKAEEILEGLKNCTDSTPYYGTCVQTDMETAQAAHHCGVSIGKYQIYLYLSEYNPSLTLEECKTMTMHQLRELLYQYETNTGVIVEPADDYQNGHHGGHHGHHE